MKPTVGTTVLVNISRKFEEPPDSPLAHPIAAVVTRVLENDEINVTLLLETGKTGSATYIPRDAPKYPGGYFWTEVQTIP